MTDSANGANDANGANSGTVKNAKEEGSTSSAKSVRKASAKTSIRWQLVIYDLILFLVLATAWTLFLLRKFVAEPRTSFSHVLISLGITAVLIFGSRLIARVYRQIWRYGGVQSYLRLCIADGIAFIVYVIGRLFIPHREVAIMWTLSLVSVDLLFALFMRMSYRFVYKNYNFSSKLGRFYVALLRIFTLSKISKEIDRDRASVEVSRKIKIMIVGAGDTGVGLASELQNGGESPYYPALFVDISAEKIGREIAGIRVIGDDEVTPEKLEAYGIQEIVFALPHLGDEGFTELYNKYYEYGMKIKSYDYPMMQDSEKGNGKRVVRDIDVEELLFRRQSLVADGSTASYYKGKTVLITGGGGSIGSELCRRLAAMGAGHIIILDIYENGAYDIQQELKMQYGSALELSVEITSVCCADDLDRVFAKYRPDVVLHAAAHKHVPLMENNCVEAVRNNVFGTLNTVLASEKYNVERFIMISTDKAVNPTNVMGATKRMCERIVLTHGRMGGSTKFSATRFGNVLGSNGSVIPLFRRQIAGGGPVTITDKRIVRYFMTIPEAAQLVLCSGATANNGELFVLDMGRPVKILDLAVNMIKLSGYVPGRDIEIVETGLRPGEKLYEELLIKNENLLKTDNEKIFIEQDTPISPEELDARLDALRKAVDEGSEDNVRAVLKSVVETFRDPDEVNSCIDSVAEIDAANKAD